MLVTAQEQGTCMHFEKKRQRFACEYRSSKMVFKPKTYRLSMYGVLMKAHLSVQHKTQATGCESLTLLVFGNDDNQTGILIVRCREDNKWSRTISCVHARRHSRCMSGAFFNSQ